MKQRFIYYLLYISFAFSTFMYQVKLKQNSRFTPKKRGLSRHMSCTTFSHHVNYFAFSGIMPWKKAQSRHHANRWGYLYNIYTLKKYNVKQHIWDLIFGRKKYFFIRGLAKPSWNFNSVYRVEVFTCACNVILKRSLLFSRDEISTWFSELKFQPGLKISI